LAKALGRDDLKAARKVSMAAATAGSSFTDARSAQKVWAAKPLVGAWRGQLIAARQASST
jgi:hypothetical protein